MNAAFFAAADASGPLRPTMDVRGQLVIRSPGAPYGPVALRRTGRELVALAELDTIWDEDEDAAERILDDYQTLGGNHIMGGPVWANGYHGEYPNTNWLGRADAFGRYLRWLNDRGIVFSLVVGPDNGPYYDDGARTFDWRRMEELTAFYRELANEIEVAHTVSQWEQWQRRAEARRLFQWQRACHPKAIRVWHTPPGHLTPGDGFEEDRPSYESAASAGIHGIYLQATPPHAGFDTTTNRWPVEQMVYDLADMVRRMEGHPDSPWGPAPILDLEGRPLFVAWGEGTAASIYNHFRDYGPEIGIYWRRKALAVPGVTLALDGLPEAA